MSRILFAWELGSNLGHLTRIAPIAARLRSEGHEVLVAARDLRSAAAVLGATAIAFVQAPLFHRRAGPRRAPACHAEMLALEGYADGASLWGRVRGWISIARLFRADAIVTDHSPGALIAGRILGLPQAQIGHGFEIPPHRAPLPSIRPWENVSEQRLLDSERKVTEVVNGVIRSFRGRELARLADLFATEERIFATFAELDPFGPRPDERYVGPIYEAQAGDEAGWPEGSGPCVYAYLRHNVRGVDEILRALKRANAPTVCFLPDAGPAAARELASEKLRIALRPLRLDSVLARADLAVLYGGHGVMSAALAAGVPILAAPQNVEQYLHSQRVEALGCGATLGAERSVAGISGRIRDALADGSLKAKAQAFSRCYSGYDPAAAVADATAVVRGLVYRQPPREPHAPPAAPDDGRPPARDESAAR